MKRVARLSCTVSLFLILQAGATAQQFADPEFDAKFDRPAFTDRHPVVFIDAAHNNFHTADGRYKPFADLLKNDGYTILPNKEKFTSESLKGCEILVISNAQGALLMRQPQAANPAFEPAECDAVHDWIQAGGSVLLIADHHPWGTSNEILATQAGRRNGQEHDASTRPTRRQGLPGAVQLLAPERTARRPPDPRWPRWFGADRPCDHIYRPIASRDPKARSRS